MKYNIRIYKYISIYFHELKVMQKCQQVALTDSYTCGYVRDK